MFFAGHMILSYFINGIALKNRFSYSLPLIFAASILPDIDFIFYPLFAHHTITHSLTFWLLIYSPFLIIKWRTILPYFLATISHFLIGDVITGYPPLFYGISDQTFGLVRPWLDETMGRGYAILYQAIVEAIMVLSFTIVTLRRKDIPPLFSAAHDIKHVLLLGIIVFVVFLGGFRNDIVYVLGAQSAILYLAYAIVGISQSVLIVLLLRGTDRIAILKRVDKD